VKQLTPHYEFLPCSKDQVCLDRQQTGACKCHYHDSRASLIEALNKNQAVRDSVTKQMQESKSKSRDTSKICEQMKELAKHSSSILYIEKQSLNKDLDLHEIAEAKPNQEFQMSGGISSRDEFGINDYYKRSLD